MDAFSKRLSINGVSHYSGVRRLLKGGIAFLLIILPSLAESPSHDQPPIAILEFEIIEDRGLDFGWAKLGLADLLQVELQKQGIQTLDRDYIRAMLNEQRLFSTGMTKDELSMGRFLKARCLVRGNLTVTGDNRIRLSATAVSVPENQIQASVSEEGLFPDELPQLISALGKALATHLSGFQEGGIPAPAPTNTYLPMPEVLIFFYKGIELCAQGFPEHAVGWFICAGELDLRFVQAGYWERKAYQMAGFSQYVALYTNTTDLVSPTKIRQPGKDTLSSVRTLAVLDPFIADPVLSVTTQSMGAVKALRAALEEPLLRSPQVRLFNTESFASVIGELDLHLSSGFGAQSLPLYDKWLVLDGLLFCSQFETNGRKRIRLEILDPISGSVLTSREEFLGTNLATDLTAMIEALLTGWKTTETTPVQFHEPASPAKALPDRLQAKFPSGYQAIGQTLWAIRQGEDQHRQLYGLFMQFGRTRFAAYELNYILDSAIESKDPAVWLDSYGWAIGNPLVPVVKHELLGDRVIANSPESAEAAQILFWRGMQAYNGHDWNKAADYFQHASSIHRKIDTADAIPPYDYTIYEWICRMAMRPSGSNESVASFYLQSHPEPTASAEEVPWKLFECFGDRVIEAKSTALAARCVWSCRGTRAFEQRQWPDAINYLGKVVDGIMDNPECAKTLNHKSAIREKIWMASTYCLLALSATELGRKEEAQAYLRQAERWLVLPKEYADYPHLMVGIPLPKPGVGWREGGTAIDFEISSYKPIHALLVDLRIRLEGGATDAPPNYDLQVRQLDIELNSTNATFEQLDIVRVKALRTLDALITDWKISPEKPYSTGPITNMSLALRLLQIARDITYTPDPKRIVGYTDDPSLRQLHRTMVSPETLTNSATADLKVAAVRVTTAYRAVRGLEAMDCDMNVPTVDVLMYHREMASLLTAAGLKPDWVSVFDPFFHPPRLNLALLPGILEQSGFKAADCERISLDALSRLGSSFDSAPWELSVFVGNQWLAEHRYQKSLEWYQRAKKTVDSKRLAWDSNLTWEWMIGLCRCAAILNRVSEADEFLNGYVRPEVDAQPSNCGGSVKAWVWFFAGRQCQDAHDDEVALLCYDKTRQLTKDQELWANTAYYEAHLYHQLGRKEKSAAIWKEIATALPSGTVNIWVSIRGKENLSGMGDVRIGQEARVFLTMFRQGLGDERSWQSLGGLVGCLTDLPKAGDQTISIILTKRQSYEVWPIQIKSLWPEDLEYLKSLGWQPETR